ncbi:PREDICTED: uncharacterized protein LOC109352918 [Lupinus angustifolius]|uniref:uncharacterized protein LOC109352918 n=1 Tax=Lupinus angustifolius TaxID=3871 RepID=UPI00092EABF0|nr:PREDICTED: uncharacterized protein LOC109352918 [Lupinus angustifolius]
MKAEFEMSDLGELSYFLGIEFSRVKEGILMHQEKYINDVLKRFNMEGCNAVSTPIEADAGCEKLEQDFAVDNTLYRQIVGCLRYICNTRPDIAYGVGVISRHMESPKKSNLMQAKRILRYVKGTLEFGLILPIKNSDKNHRMLGFSYADWCGDKCDRKSTSGYMFFLGEGPISWSSKK